MTDDAYEVCRYVRHYHAKNGYAPTRKMCMCSSEFIDQLVANDVVKLDAEEVFLTDKGLRMATTERHTGGRHR